MKRMLALALCAMFLVGGLAACKGEKEPEITLNDYTSGDLEAAGTVNIPPGWISFGTIDDDNNVTVSGLHYLRSASGETVVVSDMSEITANVTELGDSGDIASITADGRSVPVLIDEEGSLRMLYAEKGDASEDPDVTDYGSLNDPDATTRAGASTSTTKPVTTTAKPLATAEAIKTTAKPTGTKDPYQAAKDEINNNPNMTPEERREALKLLGYKMDKNGIFYVEHEPWQKQFGFNQIYDVAAPLVQMVYATVRIKFRYGYVYKLGTEGAEKGKVLYDNNNNPIYETDRWGKPIEKDWMIQMWKGRYGLVMLGAEVGAYTKPANQSQEHYYSAVAEEELVMAMDIYQQNMKTKADPKHLFTRGPESNWWLTGFVPGSYIEFNNKPEVIAVINIQFPDDEMLGKFVGGIKAAGFREGSPSKTNPETYRTSGTSIKIAWQFLDQDG